jgi:4-amino-4-deoxy-L-arabinose transferase-like glycosyltransferase
MNKKTKVWIMLVLIIALGFFLRVYNINNAPPGVYPDEAVNGTDAARANDTGQYQWFYPDNQGREGLMMNLVALSFKLFGISAFSLKFPSIIAGVLAILGIFLLAKELFGNRVGLISAFLVSVSFWPINFSRISFRANLLPAVLVFSFYFLFLGLRTKKWYHYAISGFIFGIGIHTYIAWRIAPAILILFLIFAIISRENFLKESWKMIVIFLATALISSAPMLYTFFISHPEYFESRSDSISVLSSTVNHGHLIQTLSKSIGLSLVKYNFWGDQNWRDNYPPYPLLDYLTGVAFLFGLILSVIKFFKLLYQRFRQKIKDTRLEVYAFLILWFFIMLSPEFLTAEGLPHALRSIGTLPVVFIFAALTFDYLWTKGEKNSFIMQRITSSLVIIMLVSIGIFNPIKYFVFWANNVNTAQAFEENITELSSYAKTLPANTEIYAILGNMQRVPPRLFNWGNPNFHDLHPVDVDKIMPARIENTVFIFSDYLKDSIINNLTSRFPNLSLQEFKDKAGLSFYVLK